MRSTLLVLVALVLGTSTVLAQDISLKEILPAEYTKQSNKGNATLTINLEVEDQFDDADAPFVINYSRNNGAFNPLGAGIIAGTPIEGKIREYKFPVTFTEHEAGDTVLLTLALKVEGDDDPDNDTLRIRYRVASSTERDLEVKLDPTSLKSTWETYSDIQLDFDIKNVGIVTFKTNRFFKLILKIDDEVVKEVDSVSYFGPWINKRDSNTVTAKFSVEREIPLGETEICAELVWVNYFDLGEDTGVVDSVAEVRIDNNVSCFNVNMVLGSVDEPGISALEISHQGQMLWVDVKDKASETIENVEVVNLSGQVVLSQPLSLSTQQGSRFGMSTEGLPNGVYVARLNLNNGRSQAAKFIIR